AAATAAPAWVAAWARAPLSRWRSSPATTAASARSTSYAIQTSSLTSRRIESPTPSPLERRGLSARHAQLDLADLDDAAGLERHGGVGLELPAVDPGPVHRVEVLEAERAAVEQEAGVVARHRIVVDDELGARAAADEQTRIRVHQRRFLHREVDRRRDVVGADEAPGAAARARRWCYAHRRRLAWLGGRTRGGILRALDETR